MSYIVVIPARYDSSRFPGKPLVEICGVPMIVRTFRQCIKAVPEDRVYVATDSNKIKEVCNAYGIRVVTTSSQCLTGTDRVAEVAHQIEADTYINVQGDEPVFNPVDLRMLVDAAEKYPDDVLNGYCPIDNESSFRSGNTPKVVVRPDGRLLYMSRAPIPTSKTHTFVQGWRQVCAYAFPRRALAAFTATGVKTPLESIEDIEILRFLELGWEVRMLSMSSASISVDTPEDVEAAEVLIASLDLQ